MRPKPPLSAKAATALLASVLTILAVSPQASAQQPGASADERHACQVTGDLIKAWINDRAKVASFMTADFNQRRGRQLGGNAGRQTDIRITGAEVLSCTAHASSDGITVRQERRDQITHTSTGAVSYVMYGANFRVSPTSWLVEDWEEIAE
jgi:hypothetical protein